MIRRASPLLLLVVLSLAPFAGILAHREMPTFRDHFSYFAPLRWHTATVLRSGELPLWNPWNGMGEAWMANPQTGVFYPPAWLMVALPFEAGYVLFLVLHLALLGAGCWWLYARWAAPGPALIAAAAVMLSGPAVSLLDVNNNLTSLAWLPVVLTLSLKREGSERPLFLGIALAMAFLAGEPLYAAVAAGMTATILIAGRRWKTLFIAAGVSAGLAAVQIFPFLGWIQGSDRTAGLAADEAFAQAMAPGDWINAALSNASVTGQLHRLTMSQSFIGSVSLGFPMVLLALSAGLFVTRGENRDRRNLVGLLLLALGLVVILSALPRIEAVRELLVSVRFNAIRYPARFIPLGAIVIGALAAIGLDRARQQPLPWRLGLTFSLALLGTLRLYFIENPENPDTVLRLGIFLGWTITLGLVFVFFPRWLGSVAVQAILLAALAGDLLLSAQPFLRPAQRHVRATDWGDAIRAPWKFTRVAAGDEPVAAIAPRPWLAGYLNLYERDFDLGTAAPVIDSQALDFYERLQRGDREDLIDAASVRWLLTTRESLPVRYRETGFALGRVRLWENPSAAPVARLVSGSATPRDESTLQRWIDEPRESWVLTPAMKEGTGDRFETASSGRAASVSLGVRAMKVQLEPGSHGVLVLSQRWERGWKVKIDGRARTPLVANGLFAAVAVELGDRNVEWTYLPSTLIAGSAISAITVICIIVIVARRRIRSKMRGSDVAEGRGEEVISSSIAASQDFHRKKKTSKTVVILSSARV